MKIIYNFFLRIDFKCKFSVRVKIIRNLCNSRNPSDTMAFRIRRTDDVALFHGKKRRVNKKRKKCRAVQIDTRKQRLSVLHSKY